jgi:hypothetical protein
VVTLPDFSKFLDFSSLFVALIGMLFATWHPTFNALLQKPRPALYGNRKSYLEGLFWTTASQAIPLTMFILAYLVSLSGVFVQVISNSKFTLIPTTIDPAATLFMITYLLAAFLFILALTSSGKLFFSWWSAGKDRGSSPRVTLLR